MSHDLIAELHGYAAEYQRYEQSGREDRAAAARREGERVIAAIQDRIGELLDQAEEHESKGQEVLAAQARVEAKRLAAELPPEHRPERLRPLYPDAAGTEDAATPAPPEQAVPKRAAAKRPAKTA
ncbi:hypothetical protein HNP84_007330 [Thermocatellispora tengchongensis]|uniref:Uncharacterized protein n=1 Tax=Thermocatellispora tengchongensis TaxID=1073253 RepID=A0A840PD90_9ACTN|nr:hypothetical protein [Thermocatellispora tengchongensis]MBB5137578.1 hypothetical protein [Thermocatellispora tengchongensis]